MRKLITTTLLAGVLATAVASPTLAAGKFTVIELNYVSPFGKQLMLHFLPDGGYGLKACKGSLAFAISTYGQNLAKALDMPDWSKMKFVEGHCQAFDNMPSQLLTLHPRGKKTN